MAGNMKIKKNMSKTRRIIFILGRLLLSLIFIIAGIKKIFYWSAIQESVVMKFCSHSMHFPESSITEMMIHYVPLLIGLATFFELAGALILLSGYFIRVGAIFLLIFLIPTTLIYHDFWFQVGDTRTVEMAMFMKNLAIIGSLLLLSLGPRFKKKEK